MTDLLPPHPEALAHSNALTSLLIQRMQVKPLSFAEFMQACLYEPGLGYYVAGSHKFGETGDFITAPLISSLFGVTLAQATYPTIKKCQGAYLELGAGNGQMAKDIVDWLQMQGDTTTQFFILEISPDCRAKQAETLKNCLHRVHWLDALPSQFRGVLLANEVLDALPVHLFRYYQGELFERRVTSEHDQFHWVDVPLKDSPLLAAVKNLHLPLDSQADYLSEINPTLPMFIHSLINCMNEGQLIFLDYGFLREEYYHPDRSMGTLMCHYRHHAHTDPFLYPGLQDITAHVDFTAVGLAAQDAGADVALYTQAEFLLQHGLLDLLDKAMKRAGPVEYLKLSKAVQKLVDPHEMGELFKVMVVARQIA